MSDLLSKLSMRRKGISGAKAATVEVVEERGGAGEGGAMGKISGMIPPPPPMGDSGGEEENEDDWD